MIVAGHQPNYLPWLGFFHKIATVDAFMLVDTVQFVKRGTFGWMHRNRIRTNTPEGWQWLSLPVQSKGKREQTCAEAELQNQQDWRRKHWSAIEFNYRKAAHFDAYAPAFLAIYEREWTHLAALSHALVQAACDALGITTPIVRSSEVGVGGEAHELLANICRHYGASTYLSGKHGADYLDLDVMNRKGVEVVFQEYTHPIYAQCQPGAFQPYMCVLDLLFNEGPRSLEILMSGGHAHSPRGQGAGERADD